MKRIVATFFLIILMGVLTAGCGNIAGGEFVGKWVINESAAEKVEIKRNGESFVVVHTTPTFIGKVINSGESKTKEYPAVLKDGVLTINTGAESSVVSYVKEGEYLLFNGHKFIRQK